VTTFNSHKENTFHYLTFVTFARVPIFKSETICQFFIDAVVETKEIFPFKLVAYVLMPDHAHLIINPFDRNIVTVAKSIKGKSAKKTLDWLKTNGHFGSLAKLERTHPKKRNHSYSVWQKGVRSIDLESHKFVQQKSNYIHLNPVRAGLCDHPAKWKWSSYRSYFPHKPGEVPIEIDWQAYWSMEDGQRPSA
jgi:putative transposase